ncbi:hypothetical protein HDU96_006264 [Phlyctochytrium bullatum]|nr:hypothetical protein HDU96_006264 [Phlyctochytrium bullatum]
MAQSWTPNDLSLVDPYTNETWIITQHILEAIKSHFLSNTTATVTALAINTIYPAHRPAEMDDPNDEKEGPESFLLELWEAFAKIAQQIPIGNRAMVGLVEVLEALQKVEAAEGEVKLELWGTFKLWEDMPLFGPAMHDVVDGFDHSTPDSQVRWRNLHAYLSLITASPTLNLDQSIYGLSIISGILEGTPHHHPTKPPILSFQGLKEHKMAIMEMWIENTGRRWFENPEMIKAGPHGPLWSVSTGNGADRWKLWRDRLGLLAVDGDVSEESRSVAKRTLALMDAAESPAA